MPRRALLVGINSYENAADLSGCVADAESVGRLLERHGDGRLNYDCRLLLDKMEDGSPITRPSLREASRELFASFKGDVLLYYSGHGVLTESGGFLTTSDATTNDWGIPMQEVVQMAIDSSARDILVILDCCHSGDIANPALLNRSGGNPLAVLREEMTVIAASRDQQVSLESAGHGLFTSALLDALSGGAADLMGWVTAPSIYNFVERRFGAWDQRPVYKSHATGVTIVRDCQPIVDRNKLQRLTEFFSNPDHKFQLDPEYESEDGGDEKKEIARLFREYRDSGLLKASIPEETLYEAAQNSNAAELTLLGREYWWLVEGKRI